MRFSFNEDQRAIRDAARTFCADELDLADLPGREGKPADPAFWRALTTLGVLELLIDPAGSGLGVVGAAIAFEHLGAHLVTGPVLWSVLAAPFVPGVAEGAVRVTGVEVRDGAGGPVVVEHAEESDALVVLRDDRLELCARSDLPPASGGSPLDPLTPAVAFPSIPAGQVLGGVEAARQVRRSGEILSAALLVGVAQGALDAAWAYALRREQFGEPIGSFQAIKHLLADMYVRLELARAAMYAAAAIAARPRADDAERVADADLAGDAERAAGAAKLLAGEAGVANGRAAVQVLGGMGFTWDMLPHYFLKRAWVLENAFGATSDHAARLAASVATHS
ncbi:MAG: acyl-CoA dehydrogenase family protein [Frankia sp.]